MVVGVRLTPVGAALQGGSDLTLAHDVVGQLVPFLRYVVAAESVGIPIRPHGEIEPLGWNLGWRQEPDHLAIEVALPVGLGLPDRQEVILTVAMIPAVTGASIGGRSQCLSITMDLNPTVMQELSYWMDRWRVEVDTDY